MPIEPIARATTQQLDATTIALGACIGRLVLIVKAGFGRKSGIEPPVCKVTI